MLEITCLTGLTIPLETLHPLESNRLQIYNLNQPSVFAGSPPLLQPAPSTPSRPLPPISTVSAITKQKSGPTISESSSHSLASSTKSSSWLECRSVESRPFL